MNKCATNDGENERKKERKSAKSTRARMSGARGRGNIATPNASSEGNNTDPSNELLEQANEFLSNSPERQKSKDAEEDSKSESESEWTTVVSKSNGRNNNARQGSNKRNLYLDTSTLNMMKSSGKDHSPTAALSPMTKVIREAEKFVSREENRNGKGTSKGNNGKQSQRNLEFDSDTTNNNKKERDWQQQPKQRSSPNNKKVKNIKNITSPPPKVKMHQRKIELEDDDYFSEGGGTPSPNAGRKNEYFATKGPGDSKETNSSSKISNKNNKNEINNSNTKTATFNAAVKITTPPSLSSSPPASEPAFATRRGNQGRSAVSFQNLSRQSSVDQMEAMFSPSDALDAFGMPSPSGSMSNLFAEGKDEGDELSQRGKKLGKHMKIMRKESVSQIDSILEGDELDPARYDDEEDDDDENDDGRSDNSFDSDRQRRGAKGGGFGSPFKTRNVAFVNDRNDSESEKKNANNDENLDELYTLKHKVMEKFSAYKDQPDFTLEKAQEMLKKAEILLAEDAKSALEIDQRLMVLEQELREMRQDATIFFYGVGGVFLAWTGMKVIGYVASVFG